MKLFDLFGKKTKEAPSPAVEDNWDDLEVYSGMRVEVTTMEGSLLFVAKLQGLCGSKAVLHQYSETEREVTEPLPVKIRGYSDHARKAVYMEGVIAPTSKHVWDVTELTVSRVSNDRAFFRLDTNLDATATMFSGLAMGEKPCKMLNISVGGAYIVSTYRYHEDDKFLLKVRLIEDQPESALFCRVLRAVEKENQKFEYGCQFIEITEDDQEKIIQSIFATQRQRRGRS